MIKERLFRTGAFLTITTALAGFTIAQEPVPSPTVTPDPSPTVSPVPSPTVSPMPSPTMTPTPLPTPTESPMPPPMPTETPVPSPSPTMSMETMAKADIQAGMNYNNEIQNEDKWTVVEYPEGTEVAVELALYQIQNAQGWARVMRTADGTLINIDIDGLPKNSKDYYVYTVDETGKVALLEAITIENGQNKSTLKTPMSKFMLMISPKSDLTSYSDSSAVIFRSKVPDGYAALSPKN